MSARLTAVVMVVLAAAAVAQETPYGGTVGGGGPPRSTIRLSTRSSSGASQPTTGPASRSADETADLQLALIVLKENKISDKPDDLRKYLAELLPNPDQARRADELIKLLASNDWRQREQATKDLMSLPILPVDALRKAATQQDDPEVQARAAEILQKCEGKRPVILAAIFKVVAITRPDGFVKPIVAVLPCCSDDDYLLDLAVGSLTAVSKPADAALLKSLLGQKDPLLRRAGVNALAGLLGKGAEADVLKMLQDADEKVQLDAAVAAANMGNRQCLAVLLKLMESQSVDVRSRSFLVMAALTGKDLPYAPYDGEQDRTKAMAAWKEMLDKEGATVKLRLPIRMGEDESFLFGNMLIATGYKNEAIELDPSGKEVWSYKANGIWGANKLRNGNYLLAAYSDNKVIEVNRAGTVVWEYQGGSPLRATQLPNGNILIACYSGNQVLEVDRQKKIVWQYNSVSSCADARRLPGGNTLISFNGGVREVTPKGDIVWNHPGGAIYSAQRLPNGNTLVADLGRNVVEEITRDQKVVWSHTAPNPGDVYRLRNGNTLITGGQSAIEVTADGREVWSREGFNYGSVRK